MSMSDSSIFVLDAMMSSLSSIGGLLSPKSCGMMVKNRFVASRIKVEASGGVEVITFYPKIKCCERFYQSESQRRVRQQFSRAKN